MNRRTFIKKAGTIGLIAGVGSLPFEAFAKADLVKITLLHTNDTHSQIDPFPDNHPRYAGLGGIARRKTLIDGIRSSDRNVLLLDAGDFFQGTPYFNLYKGEVEMKAMANLGYDAAAIGNHDFDSGLENLAQKSLLVRFPFLCCNLDFSSTPFAGKNKDWEIFHREGLKVGIFGITMQLEGLVSPSLYSKTRFIDPLKRANEVASLLRNEKHCDLVVCLSHLGYRSKFPGQPNDQILAENSMNIDLIIGGHTHDFLDEPVAKFNQDGQVVSICQVGYAGIKLGKVEYWFEKERKRIKKLNGCALIIKGHPHFKN